MEYVTTIMRLAAFIILFIINWRCGNLKCWRKYSSTIVFIMVINTVASYLMYDYSLWYFSKSKFFPNDTAVDFWLAFVNFPLIVMLYLSRYPYKLPLKWQFAYMALYGVIFSVVEGVYKITHAITYHHGWSFWWSVLLWFIMFPIFTLYHIEKQLWAWFVCLIFTIFIITHFHMPIFQMK